MSQKGKIALVAVLTVALVLTPVVVWGMKAKAAGTDLQLSVKGIDWSVNDYNKVKVTVIIYNPHNTKLEMTQPEIKVSYQKADGSWAQWLYSPASAEKFTILPLTSTERTFTFNIDLLSLILSGGDLVDKIKNQGKIQFAVDVSTYVTSPLGEVFLRMPTSLIEINVPKIPLINGIAAKTYKTKETLGTCCSACAEHKPCDQRKLGAVQSPVPVPVKKETAFITTLRKLVS